MVKFIEKIIKSLKDPARSFKERVFILLTFVTIGVAIIALLGDIITGENIVEIIALFVTVISVPIITLISVRRNNVIFATRLVVIGVVFVILPIIFFYGGGAEGGGVFWIIFAYLYTGLVLTNQWRFVMLIVLTVESIIFYAYSFWNPGAVVQHSRKLNYEDSLLSLILVGIVCCLMVWFVEWLFNVENQRAKEEAEKYEELNHSQNRFFSSMSHEIRTPINSILGLNEIILRQEDASDEIKRDAANIQGAGRMLLALVNDILDMSKIEAGKMDIVPVDYSVSDFISKIVNMMWLPSEEKGLELKVEVDPSIPSVLHGDEVRLSQILVNILNNAIKYTSEGSVTLHIEKEDIIDDKVYILFSVADTGMGIKQDALPYLFDAFQRIDEEKNAAIEGTGLGLSIVKQLVELMGGTVTVDSVYTQGSTFMVKLWQKIVDPKAVGDIDLAGTVSLGAGKKHEAAFKAPDARILIVDDNEMNLEVERKLIEDTDIIIDTAISGEQALQMTLTDRYDMIFMDHLMPQMDGIECLQRVRKQTGGLNNHVPVIVLTANAGGDNKKLYDASGFDGYLVKPVSGIQLEEMLYKHLPESKLILSEQAEVYMEQMSISRDYSRKINVLIATNSMCDLPREIINEYAIDTIPFRIHADDKLYYDNVEASTDELIYYMKKGMDIVSEPPTVEEYEHFFGKLLKKAHQVVYISFMSSISDEYERAKEAARAYGNVTVYNSELSSSNIGMMVLKAYKLSTEGKNPWEIVRELADLKDRMQCSFVTDDTDIMMKRGFISRGMYNFMRTLSVRPFIRVKNNTFKVGMISVGDLDKCYEGYVKYAIPKSIVPDTDVIFVPYVDMTEEELEWIKEKILLRADFKRIVFLQASAVMSLNCGSGAFGLLYIEKGDTPLGIGDMLGVLDETGEDMADALYSRDNENAGSAGGDDGASESEALGETADDHSDDGSVSKEALASPEEPVLDPDGEAKWYDGIIGIDTATAFENSGSEAMFKMLLEMFYNSIDEKSAEIDGFYEVDDWENYIIRIHALKSSARLIGALELGDGAEALEMAGKSGDIDYIRTNHAMFMDGYRFYKDLLADVFKG